jgi:hypothetical protein
MNIQPNCPVCFGTGWQPMRVGAEWLKWPCQRCIEQERASSALTGVVAEASTPVPEEK